MTKDYRGYARGPCSGNPPSADDKNLEGRLPRPSTGPQVRQAPGQEGTGRLLCITKPEIVPDPESSTDTPY